MFGFSKKTKKTLLIKIKDVFSIIKSDYDNDMPFYIIEFVYNNETYTLGSSLLPESENEKGNIVFVFNGIQFEDYEQFINNVRIDGIKLAESENPVEIIRAGIVDGDAMIKSPWGDARLERYAIK